MHSITINGKMDSSTISNIFSETLGNVEYQKSYGNPNSEALVLTGSEYFLRTNDTIGFCLFSYYDGNTTKIDYGRVGGGSGLFNIRLGAGNKLENKILEKIKAEASSSGLLISEEDDQ